MRLATLCVVSLAISLTVESALAEPEGAQEPDWTSAPGWSKFVDDYLIESDGWGQTRSCTRGFILCSAKSWTFDSALARAPPAFYVTVFQDRPALPHGTTGRSSDL